MRTITLSGVFLVTLFGLLLEVAPQIPLQAESEPAISVLAPTTHVVSRGVQPIWKIQTDSPNELHLLNIEWYPVNVAEHTGAEYKPIPAPEIRIRKGGEVLTSLSEQSHTLDTNLWVLPIQQAKYLLEMTTVGSRQFLINLGWTKPHEQTLMLNQTAVVHIGETHPQLRFKINMADNRLVFRDSFVVELWVCKGSFTDLEVQYLNTRQKLEKVKKSDFPSHHGPRGYLLAHDVMNDTEEYVIDLFKRQSKVIGKGDVVVKARLLKLPPNAKPNLATLHQSLDNKEYPGGLKLASNSETDQIQISLKNDEYLFSSSGITSSFIYGYVVSGPTEDVLFRKQCSFDRSTILGGNPTTVAKFVNIPSVYTQPKQTAAGHSMFARVVLSKKLRIHTTDSGVIDLSTGAILLNSNGPGTGEKHVRQGYNLTDTAHVDHSNIQEEQAAWLAWWPHVSIGFLTLICTWFMVRRFVSSSKKSSSTNKGDKDKKKPRPTAEDPEEVQSTVTRTAATQKEEHVRERSKPEQVETELSSTTS